jgi:spermidine synthase
MKPHYKLAETTTPGGGRLSLHEHDKSYCIRLDGIDLMHSSTSASEVLLGEIAADQFSGGARARVLIAGLGLGYTLKGALARGGPNVSYDVSELMPEVVSWNREYMKSLNGGLLDHPQVNVLVDDVVQVIARATPGAYSAILLDIDNGPTAMVKKTNGNLYDQGGIQRIWRALKPGGKAAIWSAGEDVQFQRRFAKGGFTVQNVPARLYPTAKRSTYMIYVGTKPLVAA